tara:strand:+ start:986 stop:1180 length:195 start_codon:yes stop_codon:yes gene_type:complete
MKNKHVVEMYNNLLRQIEDNVGNKVDIADPCGTDNIVSYGQEITQKFVDICKRRKSLFDGSTKW